MKKTLLIAAAALVAGIISSEAQVYSANVVGYVSVAVTAGQLQLISNPLDDGTNTANSLLGSTLPNHSAIQIWNGSGFASITKTSSGFAGNPSIPVGTGFFVKASTNATLTFVGNVVPAPGSGPSSLPMTAGQLQLVGSILPVSGNFNDTGTNTLNLIAGLPNHSAIQTWNGSGFVSITKTSTGFAGNPGYSVAQGFFVKASTNSVWTQNLSN
jgi:hypothetical protein